MNWESSSSSAGEILGPDWFSFSGNPSVPVAGLFDAEASGIDIGGSEVSEKKDSSSSPSGGPSAGRVVDVGIGGIVGVFLVALTRDFGLSGWGGTSTVEDGTSGAGVSSNVNQSSSSASVLVSVEIPGARKLCSGVFERSRKLRK